MNDSLEISQETIVAASQGDVGAFEKIYKMYFRFVTNVAFRVVSNAEDAQEVTQEVFMNIYRKLKSFRYESSLKTWVYRITINHAINYSKKMNKEHHQRIEYPEMLPAQGTPLAADIDLDQKDNLAIASKLLESLNSDQKACIILRSVEGLSYQEIAETLKVPINTVRSRIKRARETMLSLKKEVVQNEM